MDKLLIRATMDRDVIIQYCGPYSIRTSDSPRITQLIESTSIVIERGQLPEVEQPVNEFLEFGDEESLKVE